MSAGDQSHFVRCPYCVRVFDLFTAAWCPHIDAHASKRCPGCLRCLCDDPAYAQPHFWKDAPRVFREHDFERLFVHYL